MPSDPFLALRIPRIVAYDARQVSDARYPMPDAPLKPGDEAPDFTLAADDGSEITLSKLRGRKVVLFFYGKDFTPG